MVDDSLHIYERRFRWVSIQYMVKYCKLHTANFGVRRKLQTNQYIDFDLRRVNYTNPQKKGHCGVKMIILCSNKFKKDVIFFALENICTSHLILARDLISNTCTIEVTLIIPHQRQKRDVPSSPFAWACSPVGGDQV